MVFRGAASGRPLASPRDGDHATWIKSKLHTDLMTGAQSSLQLDWLRPSLFASPLTAVELLGGYARISFTQNDTHGVVVNGFPPACARWNCTCDDMGIYYAVGPKSSCPPPYDPCNATFGCAPTFAQNWWRSKGCTYDSYYNKTTDHVHPGCDGGGGGHKLPPHALGLVLKLMF